MTDRKPAHLTFPGWIEKQIREADAAGAFDNLSGAGKPIESLGTPHDDQAWIADWMRRENIEVAEVLPPALALAKEVEDLPKRLGRERDERAVRAVVDDLNERISQAHARPQVGPPIRVKLVDVEVAVAHWAAVRPVVAKPAVAVSEAPRARCRRWWRRSS